MRKEKTKADTMCVGRKAVSLAVQAVRIALANYRRLSASIGGSLAVVAVHVVTANGNGIFSREEAPVREPQGLRQEAQE